jgi:predicted outer membrane repeat protein
MKQISRSVVMVLAALAGATQATRSALASGVVGTGTAASCTETALSAALSGGGTVTFNCGGAATITVGSVHAINADTTIDGGGVVTISSSGTFPLSAIFPVSSGVNFSLDNLTMTNALHGCISGDGTVTVTNSTFSGNHAAFGAAIFTSGTAIITGSAFSDNSVNNCGGAVAGTSAASLNVDNSTFSGNHTPVNSGDGGAICTWHTTTITNSTFSSNSSNGQGGAIYQGGGTLTVTDSTFSGNHVAGSGLAIYNIGGTTLNVTNSTFFGNYGPGEGSVTGFGTVTITNCTFSANASGGGGNSGAVLSAGTVTVSNTILVGNSSWQNCSGPIIDGGNNLDSGATCGFTSSTGSLSNTDPMLDPAGLANNGGPTQTIALCGGPSNPNLLCTVISPAINVGNQAICAAAPVYDLDQRGFGRPGVLATNCSIGAYEFNSAGPGPTPLPTATPTKTATATPTPGPTPTFGPLDHFTCYKAGPTRGSVKFVDIPNPPGVNLVDQFGSSVVAVKKPKLLCAPTDKKNENPGTELHPEHLKGYPIKNRVSRVFPTNIKVVDQFNPNGLFVDAKTQSHLLVPTVKSLSAPPLLPGAFVTDHFQCYKVKISRSRPPFVPVSGVTLHDQFGPMTVDVKKPLFLCNPVNKNGEDQSAPSHAQHLMCYQVKQTGADDALFTTIVGVFVNNQFGPETLDVKKPLHLCVPALKNPEVVPPTPTTTPTNSTTPTLAATATPTCVVTSPSPGCFGPDGIPCTADDTCILTCGCATPTPTSTPVPCADILIIGGDTSVCNEGVCPPGMFCAKNSTDTACQCYP